MAHVVQHHVGKQHTSDIATRVDWVVKGIRVACEKFAPRKAIEERAIVDDGVVCVVHLLDAELVEGGTWSSISRLSFVKVCCWVALKQLATSMVMVGGYSNVMEITPIETGFGEESVDPAGEPSRCHSKEIEPLRVNSQTRSSIKPSIVLYPTS